MISERTIEAVRERTDLGALVAESVRLKRVGRALVGLCPFHSEKTPSFSVNVERGFFQCYGCKEHGSAIDFVMKLEGKTFPEAVRVLAERTGIEVEDTRTEAERREEQAARRAVDDLYAVNALAATFFEHSMRGGPGQRVHILAHYAAEELARRGLALGGPVDATLRAYRIGYAPAEWDGLTAYLAKHGVSPAVAERVGLLIPRNTGSGHYDRFRHRLIFAVLDVTGRVIAFSGRALPEPSADEMHALGLRPSNRTDDKPAKYINSPESPIYTKGEHLFGLYQARQAIRQRGEAVLVEGNFDVVALHARGIQHVVAPLGTAFTEVQAKLLKRFAPSVTIVFDGDSAGKKATWAARMPCRAAGLSARAADVPRGMDPDSMAQKRGDAAVTAMLANAPPLTQRLLDMVLRDGEVEGRAVHDPTARARAAVDLVDEAGDDIERSMLRTYAAQMLAALGVRDVAFAQRPAPAKAPATQRQSLTTEMSRAMLGALLDFPALLDEPQAQSILAMFDGEMVLAVVALRAHHREQPPEIVRHMPASVREYAQSRLARPVFGSQDEALRMLCAYAKTIERERKARPQAT